MSADITIEKAVSIVRDIVNRVRVPAGSEAAYSLMKGCATLLLRGALNTPKPEYVDATSELVMALEGNVTQPENLEEKTSNVLFPVFIADTMTGTIMTPDEIDTLAENGALIEYLSMTGATFARSKAIYDNYVNLDKALHCFVFGTRNPAYISKMLDLGTTNNDEVLSELHRATIKAYMLSTGLMEYADAALEAETKRIANNERFEAEYKKKEEEEAAALEASMRDLMSKHCEKEKGDLEPTAPKVVVDFVDEGIAEGSISSSGGAGNHVIRAIRLAAKEVIAPEVRADFPAKTSERFQKRSGIGTWDWKPNNSMNVIRAEFTSIATKPNFYKSVSKIYEEKPD